MDDITRQFLVLLRKIQSDIHKSLSELQSIQHSVDPCQNQDGADDNADSAGNIEACIAAVEAATKEKATYDKKNYRLAKLKYRLDKKSAHFTKWTMYVLLIYTGLTAVISYQATRSADAAKQAADTAQETLVTSESAHVSIGRKDGVVAELAQAKDATHGSGVVAYFQNSGHSPAILNFGIVDAVPPKGFTFAVPRFEPMRVYRSKKLSSIQIMGNQFTIGADSLMAFRVGEFAKNIKEPPDRFSIDGAFETCDDFGNYKCRAISIVWQGAPYRTFSLGMERECPFHDANGRQILPPAQYEIEPGDSIVEPLCKKPPER